eukprot:COSAG02_NODE_1922_length_10360_cov_38.101452_5_plen_234_part_00
MLHPAFLKGLQHCPFDNCQIAYVSIREVMVIIARRAEVVNSIVIDYCQLTDERGISVPAVPRLKTANVGDSTSRFLPAPGKVKFATPAQFRAWRNRRANPQQTPMRSVLNRVMQGADGGDSAELSSPAPAPLDRGSGANDSTPPPASGHKSVTPTGYSVPAPGENDHPGDSDAYDMFGTQWYALEPEQKQLLRDKWTAAARTGYGNDIFGAEGTRSRRGSIRERALDDTRALV